MFGKPALLLFFFAPFLFASEFPVLKSGEIFGILSSKGKAWIEVKEDEGFTHRYLSPWRGGAPTNGGGFDRKIIETFDKLVVGNRIWLSWYWDGHLRTDRIRVVMPRKKNGVFEGYLLETGDNWFDAKTSEGKLPWRFYAHWIGGLPENGGGYDSKSLEFLEEVDPDLPLRFSWSYDLRPRFDKLIDDDDEEEFVPFYEGKRLQKPYLNKPSSSPVKNPFDQANPVNPFDSANPPAGNPFDQVKPANPFDSIPPTSPANPFDEASGKPPANPFDGGGEQAPSTPPPENPFDSAPSPELPKNPFDQAPLPGNPFDSLEAPDA